MITAILVILCVSLFFQMTTYGAITRLIEKGFTVKIVEPQQNPWSGEKTWPDRENL